LFGIAFRVVGNYRQKAHRSREVSSEHLDAAAAGRNPEQEAADRELLLSAMDVLDLDHRAATVLVDLEGLTGPAAAEILGVPVNTVYSRVRNARSKLLERVRELQGACS
jgi:RNA polymerase sigma-70 factor (ECF subfamily)